MGFPLGWEWYGIVEFNVPLAQYRSVGSGTGTSQDASGNS